MEFNQIRYFTEAAEKMHFALAAEALGVAQPSLSRGIQQLEKELGVSLFDRSNKRRLRLTAGGRAFLPHAQAALAQLALGRRKAQNTASGLAGHLSVGALESAMERREFLETLALMQTKHPGITLEIIDDHSGGLAEKITAGVIDLAVCRDDAAFSGHEELSVKKLFEDELILALPFRHPLAAKEKITAADLAGKKIILAPQKTSPAFHAAVRTFLNNQPHRVEECSHFYTAQRLAEAGLGIAFLPASYENQCSGRLVCRHLAEPPVSAVYTVCREEEHFFALTAFLELLRSKFAQSGSSSGEQCTPK